MEFCPVGARDGWEEVGVRSGFDVGGEGRARGLTQALWGRWESGRDPGKRVPCKPGLWDGIPLGFLGRRTDDGGRMAEDGGRMTDDGWRRTEDGWRMADGGWRMADGGV